MKKIVFLIAVILFNLSCSQNKTAFIDVGIIMNEYEGIKALDQEIKDEQDKLRKEIESLIEPYQAKVDEYYKNIEKMSTSSRTATELALKQEKDAIEAEQEKYIQQFEKQRLDGLEIINERISELVETYAKSKGITMVFATAGTETVIYGDEKLDITQEILAELNRLFEEEE